MYLLRSPHVHVGLWVASIAVLMMVPADDFPGLDRWLPVGLDKLQHLFAFWVMAILLTRSLSLISRLHRPALTALLCTLGFSYVLEVLQILVPWRHFDLMDLAADTVGVLLAVPVVRRIAGSIQQIRIGR